MQPRPATHSRAPQSLTAQPVNRRHVNRYTKTLDTRLVLLQRVCCFTESASVRVRKKSIKPLTSHRDASTMYTSQTDDKEE